jgi:hypothetical protein
MFFYNENELCEVHFPVPDVEFILEDVDGKRVEVERQIG